MKRAMLRFVVLLAAGGLLAGCVTFEFAPTETLGCDPALAGAWRGDSEAGERKTTARFDDQCTLTGTDENGSTETYRLRTTEYDGHRYLVMQEDASATVSDRDGKLIETWPATRVNLLRYRLDGDRLEVWAADPRVAATVEVRGVQAHSDAMRDPKTGKPMDSMVPSNIYLSGKRKRLAALLREHGDTLYADMAPDKALVLQRVAKGASP